MHTKVWESIFNMAMINSLFAIYESQKGSIGIEQIPDIIYEATHISKNMGTGVEVLLTDKMGKLTPNLTSNKRPKTLVIFDDCYKH